MGAATFGIFDHIEGIQGTPTSRLFKDRLELITMADQGGFAGYYLSGDGEHPARRDGGT